MSKTELAQPFRLRDALPDERKAVPSLVVDAYREFAGVLGDGWTAFEGRLRNIDNWSAGGQLIVAEVNGDLAGSVAYCPPGKSNPSLYEPEWASILVLAVVPTYRGRGIGRALTEECIQRGRLDETEIIALHTAEFNEVARPMYERMGFQVHSSLDRPGPRFGLYTLRLAEP